MGMILSEEYLHHLSRDCSCQLMLVKEVSSVMPTPAQQDLH